MLKYVRPELIPLIVNSVLTIYYIIDGREIGKCIYWFGAVILTFGLYLMRG